MDQYMEICHLWEDNYFQLLFDGCEENIIKGIHGQVVPTILQYASAVVEFLPEPRFYNYMENFVDCSIYLYPYDHCGHLECNTQ